MRTLVLVHLAFAGAVVAQTGIVVPAAAATRDGTTNAEAAGFTERRRQQVLIGTSLLSPLLGRTIDRLTFRRDGALPPLVAGQTRLQVSVSIAPFGSIEDTSLSFDANHGAPTTIVFDATVDLPAAPRLSHRNGATWSVPDIVTVPFSAPFTYPGGILCLEFRGEPVAGRASTWWPIDCESDGVRGRRTSLGPGCGRVASQAALTATAAESGLRPGATAELVHLTDSTAATILALAVQPLRDPFELAGLGAPGCWLHVLPDVTLPAPVTGSYFGRGIGSARCALRIPEGPASLGAVLYAQWFDATTHGLAASNGLQL